MAITPSGTGSTLVVEAEPLVDTPPKVQPLWRFALTGLGPLAALALFGLLVAFFQHVS